MDDEEMNGGSGDSVMDALEQLKGKMMEYMLANGEKPPELPGEQEAEAEPMGDEMSAEPEGAELEIEIDTEPPKPSVLSRIDGGGPPRKPAPFPPPKRGRGRPRKNF